MQQAARNGLAAILIGCAGGALFWLIGTPLPWMLGSLLTTAGVAAVGRSWALPRQARNLVKPVVGVLAGSALTPNVLAQAPEWAGMILTVVLFGVVSTLCGYFFFRRIGRYDPATAFFGSTPAGLTEMSLMGDALGGNIRSLVLIHSIRVVAVVVLVPQLLALVNGTTPALLRSGSTKPPAELVDLLILTSCGLAGYVIGRRLRLPNGILIASMILSAAFHIGEVTQAAPPDWLLVAAQVIIGCVAGSRFAGVRWQDVRTSVLLGTAWAVLLHCGVIAAALTAGLLIGAPFSELLLALAPGGMSEMTLITYSLGLDVTFVALCQVLRSFSTILLAPLVFRYLTRDQP